MTARKELYARFLEARPDRLHVAAHSHHPWPDATREAHMAAWDDAADHMDGKWGPVFAELLPAARGHIAETLHLADPDQIALGPNTHQLVMRLLTCWAPWEEFRVVTTDAEFHSFARQIRNMEDTLPGVEVTRVPAEPFDTFAGRYGDTLRRVRPHMAFFSQVFFDSGWIVEELEEIVRAAESTGVEAVVVDGYHGFLAVPTDLSALEGRIFYTAGGYKYAQAGEGACFMAVPARFKSLPLDTGWFAAFGQLDERQEGFVPFPRDGFRFWGSTFDPAPWYRFRAVMDMRIDEGIEVDEELAHVRALQGRLLDALDASSLDMPLGSGDLVTPADLGRTGRFLCFRHPRAEAIRDALLAREVICDVRGDHIRFGFGLYHDEDDIDRLAAELARLTVL